VNEQAILKELHSVVGKLHKQLVADRENINKIRYALKKPYPHLNIMLSEDKD